MMRSSYTWWICMVFFVMLSAAGLGQIQDIQLHVTPNQIRVTVDPSRQHTLEIPGGLQTFVFALTDLSPLTLHASLASLVDAASGRSLPGDRLLVGAEGQHLQNLGAQTLSLPVTGAGRLHLAVQAQAFDPPGQYQGYLELAVANNHRLGVVRVEVQIDIMPWVAMDLLQAPLAITGAGTPGESATLGSEEQSVLRIAGNQRWQLLAQTVTPLKLQSGLTDSSLAEPLSVRVKPSDSVWPTTDGFVSVSTDPTLLAVGEATGDRADGWVVIDLETRLPFTRSQAAGMYRGDLMLMAVPHD